MKRLVILGAGTAGTMIANTLSRRLPDGWEIVMVDPSWTHLYQPGLLFVPFGEKDPSDLVKPIEGLLPESVTLIRSEVSHVDADSRQVSLEDETVIEYDQLVIATGTRPRPDMTPGLTGPGWRDTVHEFYTLAGATALRDALAAFEGGRLVVHVSEMPIKCPVAPLEFAFLADAHFRERGIRDRVELVYVTPLDGAFTKPVAAAHLGHLLAERGVTVETDFMIERIDADAKAIVSYDERAIPFDLLVTVPLNKGADFLAGSGLADHLNYVQVDKHTMQSRHVPNVFALGDAADLPTSKAGATVHYSVEVFVENFLLHARDLPMTHAYDGHANCFVESGNGKGLLLDFNYETQPLPGRYPLPGIGPFALLEESELNHAGKLMFKWAYWHVLLRGRDLPLPADMSMAGKFLEAAK